MSKAAGISTLHIVASICGIITFVLTYIVGTIVGGASQHDTPTAAPAPNITVHWGNPSPEDTPVGEIAPIESAPRVEAAPPATAPGVVTALRADAAPPATAPRVVAPPGESRERDVEEFLQLVTPAHRRGVATVVQSPRGSEAGDLIVARLADQGIPLLGGVFHGGFVRSPYFERLRGGDGRLLRRAGVLGPETVALVGSVRHSFQRGEFGLITCDLSFSYVVFGADGGERRRRTFAIRVPAYDEGTALRDAVAALIENNAQDIRADLQ